MSQNYCHHINAAGVFCRGIPVKKRDYCYWHQHENGRRMKAARARAQYQRVILNFPVIDDLHAVQVCVMQLNEAILHGEIDHRTARLLLASLRFAAANLKDQDRWEEEADMQDKSLAECVVEDPGFEKQYDLPEGFDLSVDPEVAFPPPAVPEETPGGPHIPSVGIRGDDAARARLDQILHDAATLAPGTILPYTADDMELMDVYRRDGEQARVKRAAELERNRNRRERHEQRRRYAEMARNRNLQEAAERRLRDQQRQAEAAAKAQPTGAEPFPQNEVDVNRKPPQSVGVAGKAVAAGDGGA